MITFFIIAIESYWSKGTRSALDEGIREQERPSRSGLGGACPVHPQGVRVKSRLSRPLLVKQRVVSGR